MCRTMNELEKVIADYRSLKAMKEQLEEELKAVEREIIGYMDANEKFLLDILHPIRLSVHLKIRSVFAGPKL